MDKNEFHVSNEELYRAVEIIHNVCKQHEKCAECPFGFKCGNGIFIWKCNLCDKHPAKWVLNPVPPVYKPLKDDTDDGE